jgi:hypothetical protein
MRVIQDKTFLSGAAFAVIGALALWFNQDYRLGTAQTMGPGYFPFIIGMLLIGLGIINVVRSLATQDFTPVKRVALRPLVALGLGVILFGVCIDRFGLIPAIVCLVVCATLAGPRYRIWEALAILAVLIGIAGGLFVYGLDLPASYLVRF